MIKKIIKAIVRLLCGLKDLILCGMGIGLLIEAGVILFIFLLGYKLELLTIIITYLFATVIGVAIFLEAKAN